MNLSQKALDILNKKYGDLPLAEIQKLPEYERLFVLIKLLQRNNVSDCVFELAVKVDKNNFGPLKFSEKEVEQIVSRLPKFQDETL